MGCLEVIGELMRQCWDFLNRAEFTVSGITFSLANVLEVVFVISMAHLLISIFIVGDVEDFNE